MSLDSRKELQDAHRSIQLHAENLRVLKEKIERLGDAKLTEHLNNATRSLTYADAHIFSRMD
jgi:hypothetical protein